MINLTIPKELIRCTKWQLIKFLFGRKSALQLNVSNISLDKMESLILHSPGGVQTSVAVKANEDGTLRVLFSPPRIDLDYVDVDGGKINPDKFFEQHMEEKI